MKNYTNVSFISPSQLKQSGLGGTQAVVQEIPVRDWHQQALIDSIRQGIESSMYANRKKYTVLIVEEEA